MIAQNGGLKMKVNKINIVNMVSEKIVEVGLFD